MRFTSSHSLWEWCSSLEPGITRGPSPSCPWLEPLLQVGNLSVSGALLSAYRLECSPHYWWGHTALRGRTSVSSQFTVLSLCSSPSLTDLMLFIKFSCVRFLSSRRQRSGGEAVRAQRVFIPPPPGSAAALSRQGLNTSFYCWWNNVESCWGQSRIRRLGWFSFFCFPVINSYHLVQSLSLHIKPDIIHFKVSVCLKTRGPF